MAPIKGCNSLSTQGKTECIWKKVQYLITVLRASENYYSYKHPRIRDLPRRRDLNAFANCLSLSFMDAKKHEDLLIVSIYAASGLLSWLKIWQVIIHHLQGLSEDLRPLVRLARTLGIINIYLKLEVQTEKCLQMVKHNLTLCAV